MGDQRNQIIKGSPSQYVKLNIGGKYSLDSTKLLKILIGDENFSTLFCFRIPLLHNHKNAHKS